MYEEQEKGLIHFVQCQIISFYTQGNGGIRFKSPDQQQSFTSTKISSLNKEPCKNMGCGRRYQVCHKYM